MEATQNIDHLAERNGSYTISRLVRNGHRQFRTMRDVLVARHDGSFQYWEYATMPAGTEVTIDRTSDAGFNGVLVSVSYVEDGVRYHQMVSAGAFEPAAAAFQAR